MGAVHICHEAGASVVTEGEGGAAEPALAAGLPLAAGAQTWAHCLATAALKHPFDVLSPPMLGQALAAIFSSAQSVHKPPQLLPTHSLAAAGSSSLRFTPSKTLESCCRPLLL